MLSSNVKINQFWYRPFIKQYPTQFELTPISLWSQKINLTGTKTISIYKAIYILNEHLMKKSIPLSSFRQCASTKLYNTSSFLILCHIALWVSFLEQARYFYNYSIRQIGLGLYNGTSLLFFLIRILYI